MKNIKARLVSQVCCNCSFQKRSRNAVVLLWIDPVTLVIKHHQPLPKECVQCTREKKRNRHALRVVAGEKLGRSIMHSTCFHMRVKRVWNLTSSMKTFVEHRHDLCHVSKCVDVLFEHHELTDMHTSTGISKMSRLICHQIMQSTIPFFAPSRCMADSP